MKTIFHSKPLTSIMISLACLCASASLHALPILGSGYYMNVLAGFGDTNQGTLNDTSVHNTGLVAGINMGYQFFHGIAIDTSFYRFPDVTLKANKTVLLKNSYAGALAARGSVPIFKHINLLARLGIGAAYNTFGAVSSDLLAHPDSSLIRLVGFGALGLDYNLPAGLSINLQGIAFTKHSDQTPSRYAILVGAGWFF